MRETSPDPDDSFRRNTIKKTVSVMLIILGLVTITYGWQMRSTVELVQIIKTKTVIEENQEDKNTKLRNAGIGAAIGAAALGTTAAIVGGIGLVAMGTGIGAPAGAGLIAAASALGAAAGGISGAAIGEKETVIEKVPRQIEYKETVINPKYTIPQYSLVLGAGIALIVIGGFSLKRK